MLKKLLKLDLQHFADGTLAEVSKPEVTPPSEPETKPETPTETMIPKTRFDEVNSKYKELAEKVAGFEKIQADAAQAQADAELKAKKEQGQFEELYNGLQKELDTYKAYETRTTALEGLINGMVETKLQSISEEFHELVPQGLTSEQTLDWLNKAESKGLFGKKDAEAKEIGKPLNQAQQIPKVQSEKLSPMDKILSGLTAKK